MNTRNSSGYPTGFGPLFERARAKVQAAKLEELYKPGAALKVARELSMQSATDFGIDCQGFHEATIDAWRALRVLGIALGLDPWEDPQLCSDDDPWAPLPGEFTRLDGWTVLQQRFSFAPQQPTGWWIVHDPQRRLLRSKPGRCTPRGAVRRWKTAEAARKAIDKEQPLIWAPIAQ